MTKKPESRLQLKIRKALEKEFPESKWWKVHGSAFQGAGQPDLDGVEHGFSFKFEVKLPIKGKPTELQLQTMSDWRNAGSISCIVETPEQAITLVKAAKAFPKKRRRGRSQYRWICRTLRSAFGEDMGYGRSTVRGRKRVPRRSVDWAINQLAKHLGKEYQGETSLVLGAP